MENIAALASYQTKCVLTTSKGPRNYATLRMVLRFKWLKYEQRLHGNLLLQLKVRRQHADALTALKINTDPAAPNDILLK